VKYTGGQRVLNRRMSGPPPVFLVHELGHNLGLLHGGSSMRARDPSLGPGDLDVEAKNCKPNYVSVMNYQ
jgi:hypothetical protein